MREYSTGSSANMDSYQLKAKFLDGGPEASTGSHWYGRMEHPEHRKLIAPLSAYLWKYFINQKLVLGNTWNTRNTAIDRLYGSEIKY